MKAKLLSLALLAAGLVAPTSVLLALEPAAPSVRAAAINSPDPAQQVREMARLFRAGDVAGMARTMVPASKWEEAKLMWELHRLEPISADDQAEFAEKLAKITA